MHKSKLGNSATWVCGALLYLGCSFVYAVDPATVHSMLYWEWTLAVSHWVRWLSWVVCLGLNLLALRRCQGKAFALRRLIFLALGLGGIAFALAGSLAKDEGFVWSGGVVFLSQLIVGASFAAFTTGVMLALVTLADRYRKTAYS